MDQKILVVVCSAGIDPWYSIEEAGQRRTWGAGDLGLLNVQWLRKGHQEAWGLRETLFRRWSDYKLRRLHHNSAQIRRREEDKLCEKSPSRIFSTIGQNLLRSYTSGATTTHEGPSSPRLNVPHDYGLSPITTLGSLVYIVQNWEFDYLVRITSTQYLRANLLAQQISSLPPTRVYGGYRFSGIGGHPFMSGAFNIMSRDVVESVVAERGKMRLDVPDDVGLGWLIEHEKLAEAFPLPMETVSRREDFQSLNSENPAALIRCRPTKKVESVSPSLDLMLDLHEYLR